MSVNQVLLKRFIQDYPFQPATGFWRAVEIDKVISSDFPTGFGLDLGCGDGKLTKIILDSVGRRKLVGIDIDPKETEQAKELGIYERIHTVPGDKIPEKDVTFDFAFSNSVLEHIDNIDDVIAEVSRVLKPGGVFLFTVPGNHFHDCLRGPILPIESRETYLEEVDQRCAHKRYWGVEDWKNHLTVHNLEIENCTEYLNENEVKRWETIARFTSGILFKFYGQRRHPIEIQRNLGLRDATTKLPSPLVQLLTTLFDSNLKSSNSNGENMNGCLMILARKKSSV